jgi:hypothetical protein
MNYTLIPIVMAGLTKRRHAEAALFDGEYLA